MKLFKNKFKKIKFASMLITPIVISAPILGLTIQNLSSKNNVDSNFMTAKSSISRSFQTADSVREFVFDETLKSINHTTDSKVLGPNDLTGAYDDLRGILAWGAGYIQGGESGLINFSNQKELSTTYFNRLSYGVRRYDSTDQYKFVLGKGDVSNGINYPNNFIGFSYTKNDSRSSSVQESFTIDKSYVYSVNNGGQRYINSDKVNQNFPTATTNYLNGVVTLRQTWWVNDYNQWRAWNTFSTWNGMENNYNNTTFFSNRDNGWYSVINNYQDLNNNPQFINSDAVRNGSWRKINVRFGVFDKRIWMTRQKSSINNLALDVSNLTVNDLKTMSLTDLENYLSIRLFNTPFAVIKNSDVADSKIKLEFDDTNGYVKVTVSIPRTFEPNWTNDASWELTDTNWIENNEMTKSIEIPYTDFRDYISPTDIKLSLSGNTYQFDASTFSPLIDWNDIELARRKLFEAIVGSWKNQIWNNLPNNISSIDGELSIDVSNSSFKNGYVVINSLTLNKYYDYEMKLNTTTKNFLENKTLKIIGLNRAPTVPYIENRNVEEIGPLTMNGEWMEWNASNYYTKTNIKYDVLPSEFTTRITDTIINWNDVRQRVLTNLPDEYDSSSFRFISKNPNDYNGSLDILFEVKNYNDINGNLITDSYKTFKLRLVGLKSAGARWNNALLQDDGSYQYSLSNYDKLQSIAFDSITVDTINTYLNENKEFFVEGIAENETINVGLLSKDSDAGSITLADVSIQDNGVNVKELPSMKITNFLLSSISLLPKVGVIKTDQFASEFLWMITNKYDNNTNPTNIVSTTSSEQIAMLSKLYEGTDQINPDEFSISINPSLSTAFNSEGLLSIGFDIVHKQSNMKVSYTNNFQISKKGVSSLVNTLYKDENKTGQEIYDLLSDPTNVSNYIGDSNKNLINQDGIPSYKVEYAIDNLQINEGLVSADVYMKSAVSEYEYIPYVTDMNNSKGYLLGSISLIGNDYSKQINQPTVITKNDAWSVDSRFNNVTTPEEFNQVVQNNATNQDFLKLLINVNSAPNGYVISIDGEPVINNNQITYTFKLDKAYGSDGSETANLTKSITYAFPTIEGVTEITKVNQLDGNKYAYEYTEQELAKISGLVTNPANGATTSVEILEVNNRNKTIKAEVTVSDYLISSNNQAGTSKTETVTFIGAKTATPTTITRNNKDVSQSVEELEAALDAKNKSIIGSYLTISNSNTNPEWEIVSYTKTSGKVGLYEVTINLTNNYFKNDEKMTFVDNNDPTTFKIQLSVSSEITSVIDSVATSGIEATDPINSLLASDIIAQGINGANANAIKQWISTNSPNIFKNYTSSSVPVSDIQLTKFEEVAENEDAILVTLVLNNAKTVNGIGQATFTFKITGFTNPTASTELISQISLNDLAISQLTDKYSLDVIEGNLATSLQSAISTDMTNNPQKYYVNGIIPNEVQLNGNKPLDNITFELDSTNKSQIKVNVTYIKTTTNPNEPGTPTTASFIITGFNTNNTKIKDSIVSNGVEVTGLSGIVPSQVNETHKEIIKNYLVDNIDSIIENYPVNISITSINTKNPNDTDSTIEAEVTFKNWYTNNNYVTQTETILIKGFSQSVQPTELISSITIDNLAISQITSNTLSLDLIEGSNATNLQEALKNDMANNPQKYYVNGNKPSDVQLNGNKPLDNISFELGTTNKDEIKVNVTYIKTTTNPNEPGTPTTASFIITGFNRNETNIKANIISNGLTLSGFSNIYPSEINDENKNAIQTYLTNNISSYLENYPNAITITGLELANPNDPSGSIEATITFSNWHINGDYVSQSKKITLKGFKTNILTTTLNKTSIRYDDSLFSQIFNGYSSFSSDWALTNYVNLTEAGTKLKNYINNNKSEMFNNVSNNTVVDSVTIATPSNDVAEATISYKGWLDGIDNTAQTGIIQIRLQSTPTNIDALIKDSVNTIYTNATNKPTDSKGLADIIQDSLKDKLGSSLPQNMLDNIVVNPEKIETSSNMFNLKDGAITLNGTNVGEFSIERKTDLIDGSTNLDNKTWLWYLIGAFGLLLLILVIIIIARIVTNRKSDNTAYLQDGDIDY